MFIITSMIPSISIYTFSTPLYDNQQLQINHLRRKTESIDIHLFFEPQQNEQKGRNPKVTQVFDM